MEYLLAKVMVLLAILHRQHLDLQELLHCQHRQHRRRRPLHNQEHRYRELLDFQNQKFLNLLVMLDCLFDLVEILHFHMFHLENRLELLLVKECSLMLHLPPELPS